MKAVSTFTHYVKKTEVERVKVARFKKIMITFLGERLHNIIEKNMYKKICSRMVAMYFITCSKFFCSIIVISGTELRAGVFIQIWREFCFLSLKFHTPIK